MSDAQITYLLRAGMSPRDATAYVATIPAGGVLAPVTRDGEWSPYFGQAGHTYTVQASTGFTHDYYRFVTGYDVERLVLSTVNNYEIIAQTDMLVSINYHFSNFAVLPTLTASGLQSWWGNPRVGGNTNGFNQGNLPAEYNSLPTSEGAGAGAFQRGSYGLIPVRAGEALRWKMFFTTITPADVGKTIETGIDQDGMEIDIFWAAE